MASVSASMASTAPILRTEFSGSVIQGLPALASPAHLRLPAAPLTIRAGTGKKVQSKEPVGPSGENKFRNGVDASGRKSTGKGVYQYTNKYGVNVDGYSPIYTPEEWSANGDTYAGGVNGLILWAITLGAVLLGGVLLVYNTSALAQ